MRLVDPFLMELEQESKSTRRVLERVPENKLSWKPHPRSFSLGQLALHVANIPQAIAHLASQDPFEIPNFSQAEATSRKEILDGLDSSLKAAKEILNGFDDARMMATWHATRNGVEIMAMPRMAMLRTIMFNHLYHHRGQLQVYLRMNEVPLPSVYGPTADENPFEQKAGQPAMATN
ncbi:MAG TPA: DinB family protein [Gemmatimonadales bacterium]|jgi:uncharacterized damage-inducible protein DinB|nr:DinB family protein [Gemmatimonadales bacterium]